MNYSLLIVIAVIVFLFCLKKYFYKVEPFESQTEIITPTIPLHIPARINCNRQECTDNLDCPVGFRCCNGKCQEQVVVSQIRGDNLWVPQRMTVCPSEVTKDNHRNWISGTFEDIQLKNFIS